MVVREDEDEEEDEAEEVEVPVEEARVLGEDGEDPEEDELQEVAGEGEDEAEEDLHQRRRFSYSLYSRRFRNHSPAHPSPTSDAPTTAPSYTTAPHPIFPFPLLARRRGVPAGLGVGVGSRGNVRPFA